MSTISKIILGIGNTGRTYEGTRHNIGFDVIEALALKATTLKQCTFKHTVAAEATFGDTTILLMKPLTFVNLSGLAAKEVLHFYELSPEDLMVVVDDFHINLGTLRFRRSGSSGGHNGLKSIIEECSDSFHRLRFGIGPLPEETKVIDFVLSHFLSEERDTLQEATGQATEALLSYLENGLEIAMNQYNS